MAASYRDVAASTFLFAVTALVSVAVISGTLYLTPAFVLVGVGALALLALYSIGAAVGAVVVTMVFTSTIVAMVMPDDVSATAFSVARGSPFVYTLVVAAIGFARVFRALPTLSVPTRSLCLWMAGALVVSVIYGVYGAARNDMSSVTTYFRNVTTPFLLFFAAIAAGFSGSRRLYSVFFLIVCVCIGWAALEFFARRELYDAISIASYLNQKTVRAGVHYADTDAVLNVKTIRMFNQNVLKWLDVRMARLQGPNIHPISFSYLMVAGGAVALAHRRYALFILATVVAIGAGSKGALFMLVLGVGFALWSERVRPTGRLIGWSAAALVGAFIAATFIVGYLRHDYHVIGAIGGVKGFLGNPIGHGLGAGGNLGAHSGLSVGSAGVWQRFQVTGSSYGLESALGVLLYQLGVATVFIVAPLVVLCRRLITMGAEIGSGKAEFVLVGVLISALIGNGVMQEEAIFAPLALGVVMIFAGTFLGEAEVRRMHAAFAATGRA